MVRFRLQNLNVPPPVAVDVAYVRASGLLKNVQLSIKMRLIKLGRPVRKCTLSSTRAAYCRDTDTTTTQHNIVLGEHTVNGRARGLYNPRTHHAETVPVFRLKYAF